MAVGLTFKIEAPGWWQAAGDHGVMFLFFFVKGCVFGAGVAVGFESLLLVSEDLNKNPTYIGFCIK
jgi:hypothetical protein